MTGEQRNDWRFEASPNGWLWHVRRRDGRAESCARSFPTLDACVRDAVQFGYIPWTPEAERRAAPSSDQGMTSDQHSDSPQDSVSRGT